jgi:hypothetical protein
LEHVAREVDQAMAERLSDTVRRIFGRVLKELADLDNPMRTLLGDEPGDGALLAASVGPQSNGNSGPVEVPGSELPQLPEPPPEQPALDDSTQDATATPGPTRSRALPTVAPDPTPGVARSRFDADTGIVLRSWGWSSGMPTARRARSKLLYQCVRDIAPPAGPVKT